MTHPNDYTFSALEEEMTINERYKYLMKMGKRCQEAGRWEGSPLWNEMETVKRLHRKKWWA